MKTTQKLIMIKACYLKMKIQNKQKHKIFNCWLKEGIQTEAYGENIKKIQGIENIHIKT